MGEYTTNKNLYKPAIGEKNWGALVNTNFDILDSELNTLDTNKSQFILTRDGELTISGGTLRLYNHTGRTLTLSALYIDVGTAPTGDNITIDLHKNGTTIFTNQAHRPQILATEHSGFSTSLDITEFANGAYLTLDVDVVGSIVAGGDLTATIIYIG